MITNNKIKTTAEAIHYLNEVVLGMSPLMVLLLKTTLALSHYKIALVTWKHMVCL